MASIIYASPPTPKAPLNPKSVEPLARRSGNYAPSIWSFDYIQSLTSEYMGEAYKARADTLKKAVKMMIPKDGYSLLTVLELVDDLQRLGISYHFENEISNLLEMVYSNYYKTHDEWHKMDLNLKALGFRLLRQRGYPVSQEIFQNFKVEITDTMGVLNLYEASYHSFEDESVLNDARDITTKYLKDNQNKMDESISTLVSHALETPLHLSMPRVEAKWFIKVYENRNDMNSTLIELAKLDYNMVQAGYLEDLKDASRWWRNTRWDNKLTFARDRLVECFLWSVGATCQPKFSHARRNVTRVVAMITTIDDVYDVYGTLDELEKFTDVVTRWDVNMLNELPDYMKICFLGFYNTINEIMYNTLIDSGVNILPYLTKAWEGLCKAYLLEARWYYSRYTPTLKEYMDNACISIATHLVVMHIRFSSPIASTEEIQQWFEESKNTIYLASYIGRLADDLGTSSDELARGDTPKAMQCYMHETGATEDEARAYIHKLMTETWKKLNKERENASQQLREFIEYVMDAVRMGHFMYSKGDMHGRPSKTKSHMESLLFDPLV